MRRMHHERARTRSHRFYLFGVTTLGLTLAVTACGKTESDSGNRNGSGGTAGQGGSPGSAGTSGRPHAGSGGTPGSDDVAGAPNAGTGGDSGAAGADSSEAGAPTNVVVCQAGGTLFVVGNYVNAAGDELFLRSAASAATLALVPKAPAAPAKPPQLFAVERACAPGGAFILRDASSHYRLDFSQSGSQIALCLSSPVATLDAAAQLPAADLARANDTGCAGQPFAIYTAEAL